MYGKRSFFPNNDFLRSYLIVGNLSYLMRAYYAKLAGRDILDRGNLLLVGRIKEQERQQRLGRLSLYDIFTTGLPEEDSIRYYSS